MCLWECLKPVVVYGRDYQTKQVVAPRKSKEEQIVHEKTKDFAAQHEEINAKSNIKILSVTKPRPVSAEIHSEWSISWFNKPIM